MKGVKEIEQEIGFVRTLRDFGRGEPAWIPVDEDNDETFPNCEVCLVMRTDVGYVSLETGFTQYQGALDLPAIPANVKVVEDD